MSEQALIQIEFVVAQPEQALQHVIKIPLGSTLAQALQVLQVDSSGFAGFGIFGEIKPFDYVLIAGDRIEAYRPLYQDPKLKRMAKVDRQTHLPRRCR